MIQIALDITDYVIIYSTYVVLLIYIYLFIANFSGHFKFYYRCPCIIKDEEVSGIYPTLLIFYILISFLISSFIVHITREDAYYLAHSTINYTNCYMRFEIFSTNILSPNFMSNGYDITILWTICILFLLETYFSYNRYYGCMMVAEQLRAPSKLSVFLPYTIYITILLSLIWCIMSIIPIIIMFLCIFHVFINTYFAYFFYVSVKQSYTCIFKLHQNLKFIGDAYDQMHRQIQQIRFIYVLATLSSVISAFITCSFTLCGTLRLVPFGLCCNSICIFLMFTKNKSLLSNTLRCKWKLVNHAICKEPCTILKKRRESVWGPPSTLMKIKTHSAQSLKVLRNLPKQMTPKKFVKVRTRSNTKTKMGGEAPPNTPCLVADANLDVIEEDEVNKFSLDGKRNSNTNTGTTSDDMTMGMMQLMQLKKERNYLKPYNSLTKSSSTQTTTQTTGTKSSEASQTPSPYMTSQRVSDTFTSKNLGLDTIQAEDEIIQFETGTDNHKTLTLALTVDTNSAAPQVAKSESVSSPKKYRTRHLDDSSHSTVVTPIYNLYNDESEIMYPNTGDIDGDEEQDALGFGRMQNLRATMREDHIAEIKIELAALNEMDEETEESEEEKKEKCNSKTDDRRNSLQKQVQQIEFTKEELERERKLLQLKKKTSKRIAFGADMALEILQESIAKQEEMRKIAQHEFYVQQLYSVKTAKASTAHIHHLDVDDYNKEMHDIVPTHTPRASPRASLFDDEDEDDGDMLNVLRFRHDVSRNTKSNMSDDMNMILTSFDLDALPTDNGHLRSRSDNEMIKDIANQMTMYAKQIKNINNKKQKTNNNKKKMLHPKPRLNLYSASEDQETKNKLKNKCNNNLNLQVKIDRNYLSPNDIKVRHLKYEQSDEDVLDIYDNIRGIEKSPSPPPNALFESYANVNHQHNNTLDMDKELNSHSILQTIRSWISPSQQSKKSKTSSIRDNSERANNINSFLKMQGLTIHSTLHNFVDIMAPIEENKQPHQQQQEPEETCIAPIGHGVFNINTNEIDIQYVNDNNNAGLVPTGHMIMNMEPIHVNNINNNHNCDNSAAVSDERIRSNSTAL